jgi:hypothetical protein
MSKNKVSNLIIFTILSFILFTTFFSLAKAEESNIPDNVKIITSNDGHSTTIFIDSKPGYFTSIETNCVNGKCTHNTISKKIDEKEIQDKLKKQREYWDSFWKRQEEYFKAQQKLFQDLWSMNFN